MAARSLTEYFYEHNIGYSVSDEYVNQTTKVIEYLLECGFNKEDIISIVLNNEYDHEYLTFEDLPERLWKESLLEKNKYYMHQELHLNSGSDVVDIYSGEVVESNHAIEMKIAYGWMDVLKYYCNKFDTDINILNINKEVGALQYIYDLCAEKYTDLNSIDVLLYLIDNAASNSNKFVTVLNLQDYLYDTIVYMYSVKKELEYNNYNKIIWR